MLALWTAVTFLRPQRVAYSKGELGDVPAGLLGDHLDGGHDARCHLVLEAGVEVLGVLAHDDHVDGAVGRLEAGDGLHGTHVGEELELLAQADVGGDVTTADGGRGGALERHPALLDRLDRALRQRIPLGFEGTQAHGGFHPLHVESGCLDHAAGRLRDFGSNAISGQECDAVLGHQGSPGVKQGT